MSVSIVYGILLVASWCTGLGGFWPVPAGRNTENHTWRVAAYRQEAECRLLSLRVAKNGQQLLLAVCITSLNEYTSQL